MKVPFQFRRLQQSFLVCVLASSLTVRYAQAADPAATSGPSFALVPPQDLARFPAEAASPAGQAIIARAKLSLGRPPSPLPTLHIEGTLPHQGIYDASIHALYDVLRMRDLALAHALTGEQPYLDAANQYLEAWLSTYVISFNPIDESDFDQMIMANDLAGEGLSAGVKEKMPVFLRHLAEGYLNFIDEHRAKGKEDKLNWQSHRLKLAVLASFALGDPALMERAHQAFARQVFVNIAPGGEVADFGPRDALHYVTYDLEPLTVAALAAKAHGQDWFHAPSESGSSVALAVDWLTPYATGEKTHAEFVHSQVSFDAKRDHAGVKGYSGAWNPATSVLLYQEAAMADPKYQPILQKVLQSGGQVQDWLSVLAQTGL